MANRDAVPCTYMGSSSGGVIEERRREKRTWATRVTGSSSGGSADRAARAATRDFPTPLRPQGALYARTHQMIMAGE